LVPQVTEVFGLIQMYATAKVATNTQAVNTNKVFCFFNSMEKSACNEKYAIDTTSAMRK
jgi:hypothetical protein